MTRVEYLGCVFCGNSTHLSRISDKTFSSFDAGWNVLQVRRSAPGPGRGHKVKGVGGFQVVSSESLNIEEMLGSSEYGWLAEGIKKRLLMILSQYLERGIITREEIEELL